MDKQYMHTKLRSSKVLRAIGFPVNVLYRARLLREYRDSEDSAYLRGLKGKYAGKRCFVIGNGPSLLASDLDKLTCEYTFASNKIYRIYDATKWRPTFYMSLDTNVIDDQIDNIKAGGGYPKFINYKAKKYGRTNEENIWYLCAKGKFRINPYDPQSETLSEDVSQYVAVVHTVTVSAIELAIYMGFNEIYLLGVDNNYANKADRNGKIHVDSNVKADYFQETSDGKAVRRSRSIANMDSLEYSYCLAKRFADEHGVKIYNATRGGKLETFERIDFDAVVK